ncbi:MAG: glycosyltransferase family 4 protein, partial [Bacteroidales bacterium]|nr:glycosyltransferase family 4 protein [Bacteroidales bacterium]
YKGWLAHIGNITHERVSVPFLSAIGSTHNEIPELFRGLLCVGDVCHEFKSLIKKLKLEKCIHLVGHLRQEEALKIAEGSDALLVLEADMETSPFLPSKFADYMLIGKPIIAVTPQVSPIRDYLKTYSQGVCVSHNEKNISTVLKNTWMEFIGKKMMKKHKLG